MDPVGSGSAPPARPRAAWVFYAALALALGAVALLAVSSMRLDAATYDEPAHIANGYLRLTRGTCGFYKEQPPLMDVLAALPLVADGVVFPVVPAGLDEWQTGRALLFHSGNDPDRSLFLARLPVLAVFLLLCLLVGAWVLAVTRQRWLALLGVVLAGFCPNLLAHGRLATSDVGVTFFVTLCAFLFVRAVETPRWPGAVLAGVAMGCAFLSKVSGLVLLPYVAILTVASAVVERRTAGSLLRALRRPARQAAIAVAAALATVEVLYGLLTLGPATAACHPALAGTFLGRLAIPAAEYAGHLGAIAAWVSGSGPSVMKQFLLGRYSTEGWWYYYPVAFLLKTTLATLLLVAIFGGLLAVAVARRRGEVDASRRRLRFHAFACAAFVALFFLATLSNRINLGVRYVLPVYPFLYVLVALAVADAASGAPRRRAVAVALVAAALTAWHAGASAAAHPSYVGYFNEIVGNGRDADRYLIDSNLDWGQDLRRLGIWAAEHDVDRLNLIYFGGGEPSHDVGDRAVPLPRLPLPPRPGYYAVSRHIYRLSGYSRGRPGMIDLEAYFAGATHVATIGSSIYVFRY